MVDRRGQVPEEPLAGQPASVASKAAVRAAPTSQRRLLEPVGIAAGEDDVGALGPGPPGGLEADARAAADQDDGLSGQFRLVLGGSERLRS